MGGGYDELNMIKQVHPGSNASALVDRTGRLRTPLGSVESGK